MKPIDYYAGVNINAIDNDGNIYTTISQTKKDYAVRPALWIDISTN